MLTRRRKTRPWIKGKNTELKLLTQITNVFQSGGTLEEAFHQLGILLSKELYSVGNGVYLYEQPLDRYCLRFSYGKEDIFASHSTLTMDELEQFGIDPLDISMITAAFQHTESDSSSPLLNSCREASILSLVSLPVIAYGEPYGIFLLISKYLHHLQEEEKHFFTIIAQHITQATEKILLTERFEQEVALKISELQESEEKYRVLFEEASDAIVLVDIDTQRFLNANRQAELLMGYSKEELLQMRVTDFWLRENEKRLSKKLLWKVAKMRSVKLHERQILRKDGRLVWSEISAAALEFRGKQVSLGIIRDVSQRKQVELEKEVIDAVNKALISSQPVHDVYYTVSQTLLNLFAFETMDIFLPEEKAPTVRIFVSIHQNKSGAKSDEREYSSEGTPIERVLRSGTPEIVNYGENSSSRANLPLFSKRLQTSLFFPLEYTGKIIGVLHFGSYRQGGFTPQHFDFLHRIAPQIAIAIENRLLFSKVNEERAVYKHLIENVNEIVFQADPKGKILFVNHRVWDILGYLPEEITGSNFFSCVIPEDLEEAKAAFRLSLRQEQPLSGEYRILHKNGAVLTISIYTRPIFEEGRAVGMQGILQNITPPPARFSAPRNGLHDLIGRSHKMQEIYDLIISVATTDSTVLIHGESGTGKELIAQAIHAYSHRKNKPFIVVNCAAYSEHLLESELFGHERGAFTGAHRRKLGRFELAKGGTIFLDEIGEIPPHSQLLLLRVLQNRTFERVGGEKTLQTDVRIVAATNKQLEKEMKAGRFREDLYYRLNVISIEVPPLRHRKDDIPHLVGHFLKKYASDTGKHVLQCSQKTLELLMHYDWYGNVRELENVIERAVVMASGSVITPAELPVRLQQECADSADAVEQEPTTTSSLYDHERQLILRALQSTQWNKYQAAKKLGITRSTLYSKIQKYQLRPEES